MSTVKMNRFFKHGLAGNHPLYGTWCNMKQRCYNPKNPNRLIYGGKGIKVCEEWNKDFIKFYNWAIKNNWVKNLTIDRIDNNKDYCPENCHFITRSENAKKVFIDNPGLNRGINSKRATLTEDKVREVKKMILEGYRNYIIAEKMKVSRDVVHRIKYNKNWKHIK